MQIVFVSRKAQAPDVQLERCAKAPCSEFHGVKLSGDAGLTWESVFARPPLDASSVVIPLELSACEASLTSKKN